MRPFLGILFLVVAPSACVTPPRVRQPGFDPAYSFASPDCRSVTLVGAELSLVLVCDQDLRIETAELFEGDFRGQAWLEPGIGPPRPFASPRPRGVFLDLHGERLERLSPDGGLSSREPIDVRLPPLATDCYLLRSAPIRGLALRIASP